MSVALQGLNAATPGRQLRAWRALHRVSQVSLAATLGTSQIAISRLELGAIRPDKALAGRIERETGVRFEVGVDR